MYFIIDKKKKRAWSAVLSKKEWRATSKVVLHSYISYLLCGCLRFVS
ncbi:hypothetical protein HMPREF1376_01897 [Enterococcus faecium R446]|nr:hypothetical protein HMPREF1376_01897 [Enterococcus faecium R446]EJY00266.1 hypothetical protein HMPREF1363_02002 [Enterococcus faecium ERV161]